MTLVDVEHTDAHGDAGQQVASGRLSTVHRLVVRGNDVAVKRARPGMPEASSAIRREARVLQAAVHPALVPVLDVVDSDEAPAIVLAWAPGGSLADHVRARRLPPAELLELLRPVADATEALHAAGELHLDVTPANILLGPTGPWLCDPAPPGAGTAGWVDPHAVAGAPASVRSDVFSLAVTMTFCLAGRIPRPDRPVDAPVPDGVAAVLERALACDPRRRPPRLLMFELDAALSRAGPRPVAVAPPSATAASVALPRTWPFPHPRAEAARVATLEHESSGDCTGSTHDTARVTGWRRTRRGG
jgi:serine/threonine protein kinase